MSGTPALPEGVHVRRLAEHRDARGSLAELHRSSWGPAVAVAQWNFVRSRAGVFRGVHAHHAHDDHLVLLAGHMSVGLRDLRRRAPTFGLATVVELREAELSSIVIPRGVAHGFFFRAESIHVYGMTHEWDPKDELGCRWDDPELAIPWTIAPTDLSLRDRDAPSLRALQARMDALLPR